MIVFLHIQSLCLLINHSHLVGVRMKEKMYLLPSHMFRVTGGERGIEQVLQKIEPPPTVSNYPPHRPQGVNV